MIRTQLIRTEFLGTPLFVMAIILVLIAAGLVKLSAAIITGILLFYAVGVCADAVPQSEKSSWVFTKDSADKQA